MATVVNFHGKNYIEPGAYAVTEYNPTSVANVAQFGNVMIIDTGLSINGSYEFSGGAGIKGELSKGLKSVYEFDGMLALTKSSGSTRFLRFRSHIEICYKSMVSLPYFTLHYFVIP